MSAVTATGLGCEKQPGQARNVAPDEGRLKNRTPGGIATSSGTCGSPRCLPAKAPDVVDAAMTGVL